MIVSSSAKLVHGISKNIILLGLVSLFTDLSSQMVFPLIPLFLVGNLGSSASMVGIVEGAAETAASLFKVVSGYWSDKIKKRKPFILFGYTISSIAKPLFALATGWQFVVFVRVAERIGKGIRNAPRDAIVAESTTEDTRGKAYGLHRAMDGIGSVLGAVLAFLLLPTLGYRKIFLYALIPGIIAVFTILFVKEKDALPKEQVEQSAKLSFKQLPKNLRLFIVTSSVFALGHFGYAFLLLKAKDIGLADQKAILLYVLFYITYTICVIPLSTLSDKIGRKPLLGVGYLLFALISVGLVFTSDLYGIVVFFAVYGVFFAMIDGVQRAFVVDLAPQDMKATSLGTLHTTIGIVALPGGYIAGLLWDKLGPESTFIYGFVLAILAAVLLNFVKIKK